MLQKKLSKQNENPRLQQGDVIICFLLFSIFHIIFYLIFIVGLVVFVISPALEKGSWISALSLGALFGLVCYATYDLTNLAVAKDWPLLVTIVDLIWGAALSALVSVITYFIAIKIGL